MERNQIIEIVYSVIKEYCETNNILIEELSEFTPFIGTGRVFDSMGLVNIIVDIETAFLDRNIEISLTSETAMSGRISPFRSVGSLCNYIASQLNVN